MRTLSLTVFLYVALQGIASAATALASPIAGESPARAETVSRTDTGADRLDLDDRRSAASFRATAERKPARSKAQVLSKDVSRPKPVRIYWFFGGR